MRFYCYKEIPVDYSHLTLEEINSLIEKEKDKCEKISRIEDLPELKNYEV